MCLFVALVETKKNIEKKLYNLICSLCNVVKRSSRISLQLKQQHWLIIIKICVQDSSSFTEEQRLMWVYFSLRTSVLLNGNLRLWKLGDKFLSGGMIIQYREKDRRERFHCASRVLLQIFFSNYFQRNNKHMKCNLWAWWWVKWSLLCWLF